MDEKLEGLGLAQRQLEPRGRLLGDAQADFAMVFDVALAQVVNQQGQVQGPLLLDAQVDLTQGARIADEVGAAFHRPNAVLVDGVLVVFVELQQASGVREAGKDSFQHSQRVQPAEQLPEPPGARNERQKLAGDARAHVAVELRHGGAHDLPRFGRDAFVVQVGQLAQVEHFAQVGLELLEAPLRGYDLRGRYAIVAFDQVAEDGAQGLGQRLSGPGVGHEIVGHAADGARVAEVLAHELLDRQDALGALALVQFGQPHLFVPVEHVVVGLAGVEVQFVAQSQQKLAAVAQGVLVRLAEDALQLQRVGIGLAIAGKAEPPHELQIAQSAARALDVRLQQKDGLAVLPPLLSARVVDRVKQALVAGPRAPLELLEERLEQLFAAGQEP